MPWSAPRRQSRFRKSQQFRNTGITCKRHILKSQAEKSPRLRRGVGGFGPALESGSMAQERTARLGGLPAALRESILRLLLAGPPRGPRDHLPAGNRAADRARRPRRPGRARDRPARPRGARDLDPDRVLAAPQVLPLGAGQRLRPAHALHHPRRPPRSPERQAAPGHAAGGRASRSPRCSSASSTSSSASRPHCRSSPASCSATSSTTTRTITFTTPCRSRISASGSANITCATISRTTGSASVCPHRSGTWCSARSLAAVRLADRAFHRIRAQRFTVEVALGYCYFHDTTRK